MTEPVRQDPLGTARTGALAAGRGLLIGVLCVSLNPILLALSLVSLGLVPVAGLGLHVFPVITRIVRWRTNLARHTAGWSGITIPTPYRPAPAKLGTFSRFRWLVTDPATWRDLGWLAAGAPIGGFLALLAASIPAYGLEGMTVPLLLYQLVGSYEWGPFWPVDSLPKALLCVPLGLLVLAVGLVLSPRLLALEARFCAQLLRPTTAEALRLRVRQLTDTRSETVDAQAAELRRIERDLHDGAQARLVSLSMSLGLAQELIADDPQRAARLLAQARMDSGAALVELRELVRGIHPPVLAERGLTGAAQALALALPLPVDVAVDLPGRVSDPVESAVYFAIAETLTNIARHSAATAATLRLRHADGVLLIEIGDNGHGGADPERGSGLAGIARRLAAFDGRMHVDSPAGGPTLVSLEVPCALSSPRISPSSATG